MDILAHWRKNPICITVWDPRARREVEKYTFVGGINTKILAALRSSAEPGPAAVEYYGKGLAARIAKTKIVTCCEIFPEDNFMTLREKLYLASSIPVYRQHIYDNSQTPYVWTPYSLWTDKQNDINIDDATAGTLIKGVYVDQALYSMRTQVRVEARDTFTLIGKRSSRQYRVVDLALYVTPVHSQLHDAISDKYLGDLIYWGFIVKYWPTLAQDAFIAYIRDESKMSAMYPDMSMPTRDLQAKYDAEREIILRKYAGTVRAKTLLNLSFAITQFTAAIISVSVRLNIRNVFDQSRVTPKVPEIRAWLTVGSDRVMVQRQHISAPTIEFPSLELFRKGITFAIKLRDQPSPQFLWLSIHPNGKYYMRSTYREEDGMNFCDIYDVLRETVRPIINSINEMGRVAFSLGSKIEPLKTEKLIYQGLNIALFWRQTITAPAFRRLRESWDEYVTAGIVAPKTTGPVDRIDLAFRKGVHEYDPEQIDRILSVSADVDNRNQYSYLSNPSIHSKWMTSYGGRTLTLTMRDTDVRVDIIDIREDEFVIFRDYLAVHFLTLQNDSAFGALLKKVEYGTDRRLRRLREQDPALYNLSRHGSERNYSKICQGVRQPAVYNRGEIEKLSAKDRANLVKYWNFTKNEPAWYGCPDSVHPHIGFIVGVHPSGWCMPCCNKRQKDNEATKACLSEREFGVVDAGSRHVMVYGKEVPPERLSYMQQDVTGLFGGVHTGTVYLEGTASQTNVPEYNIIFAAARVLGVTVSTLTQRMARAFTDAFYDSVIDLCAGYSRTAVVAQILESPNTSRLDWREIQTRLIHSLFDVGIVLFIDMSGSTIVYMPQIVIDAAPKRIVYAVQTPRGFVYPIVIADNVAYSRDGTVQQRIFDAAERPFVGLRDGAKAQRGPADVTRFDLTYIRSFEDEKNKIVRKYVNLRNLCYAVMFNTPLGHVYITVDYSPHSPDGIEVSTGALDIAAVPLRYNAAKELISSMSLEIVSAMQPRGAQYTIYVLSNGFHVYTTADASVLVDAVRTIDYDPVQINTAILSRSAATPSLAAEEFYKQSVYNLILMTLSEIFDKERDNAMRERILHTAATGDLDTLQAKLSPIDYFIIKTTLKFGGIKSLRQNLAHSFDFDKVTLREIQTMPRADAISRVKSLLKDVVVEGTPNVTDKFPNMYTSCRINPQQPYCDGPKLIVRELNQYIDIIADDLRNPLLVNVIFSELWSNTIIDELMFTSNEDDKITIHKL